MPKTCDMELFTTHTPPGMEQLFGYRGHKQWVAFFWGKKIDHRTQGYCFDGEAFSPLNQLAWESFFNHLLVLAMNHQRIDGHATKRFEFGDEHQPSSHWLLLDRVERSLFAALKPCALDRLKSTAFSDANQPGTTLSVPDALDPNVNPSASETNKSLKMVAEMTAWLDDRKDWLAKNGQWPIFG